MIQIDEKQPVAVIGGGSWGTALAVQLARGGEVRLWCRRDAHAEEIARTRVNATYLPDVVLPECVSVSSDLEATLDGASSALLVVPTQALRDVLESVPLPRWPNSSPVVLACKGIEIGTLAFPSQIVGEVLGEEFEGRSAMLSGPSFAEEMARGEPTAVVAASVRSDVASAVQRRYSGGNLRVYSTPDLIGVQLCSALKNVVAIAAGTSAGLGYGANTLAALITRSLAEMARLGVALGARRDTFSGLAGVGDLVLTCTGDLSRNRHVGVEIGRGRALKEILSEMTMVAEGVSTVRAAKRLSEKTGVEMPIVEQVHAVLYDARPAEDALRALLSRPLRAEADASATIDSSEGALGTP